MEFNFADRMSDLKGSAIREMFKAMADPSMISLAGGNPAAELFPNEILAEIAADILKNNPVGALQYGISEGNVALREKIIEFVKEKYEKMIAEGLTPIKRMGQPEDIGKCVVSIAEGNFDFCTGTVIDCDGGFNVRCL
mgnify:CR=1 FL=1